ncbi:hypothetical protein BLOT_007115 [Blomia tropicalis]|nr:hypothetical protein BLOT_007115 [Blomia tropicalis]
MDEWMDELMGRHKGLTPNIHKDSVRTSSSSSSTTNNINLLVYICAPICILVLHTKMQWFQRGKYRHNNDRTNETPNKKRREEKDGQEESTVNDMVIGNKARFDDGGDELVTGFYPKKQFSEDVLIKWEAIYCTI